MRCRAHAPARPPPSAPKVMPKGYGDPMDVDRLRQRRSDKVQCYKCRGHGHIARECPHAKVNNIEDLDPEVIRRIVNFSLTDTKEEEEVEEEDIPPVQEDTPASTRPSTPEIEAQYNTGWTSMYPIYNIPGPSKTKDFPSGPR